MRATVEDTAECKIFTKMNGVYNWHKPMAEADQDGAASAAIGGQLRFKAMSMGLKGASATLTRALTRTLKDFIQEGPARAILEEATAAFHWICWI